jgi:hypothetical protein
MLIASVIVICVLVFLTAILWPRLSRNAERAGSAPFGTGGRVARKAPGPLGRWLSKPFGKSQRAIHKSGSAGRRAHEKAVTSLDGSDGSS